MMNRRTVLAVAAAAAAVGFAAGEAGAADDGKNSFGPAYEGAITANEHGSNVVTDHR